MERLFGISYKVNKETESFLACPSIQSVVTQSFRVISDGSKKRAIGRSNVREVGGAGCGREVFGRVDIMQRGGPKVGARVFDAIGPRSDGGKVKGRRSEDLSEAVPRCRGEEALGDGGDELVAFSWSRQSRLTTQGTRRNTLRREYQAR